MLATTQSKVRSGTVAIVWASPAAVEHGQLLGRALLRGRHALGARVDADDHALGAHDAGRGARGAARAAAEVEHPLAGDHRRPGERAVVEVHAAVAGQHRERVLGRRRVEGVDRPVEADRQRPDQRRARGDLGADLVQHLLGGGRGVARRLPDYGLLPHRIASPDGTRGRACRPRRLGPAAARPAARARRGRRRSRPAPRARPARARRRGPRSIGAPSRALRQGLARVEVAQAQQLLLLEGRGGAPGEASRVGRRPPRPAPAQRLRPGQAAGRQRVHAVQHHARTAGSRRAPAGAASATAWRHGVGLRRGDDHEAGRSSEQQQRVHRLRPVGEALVHAVERRRGSRPRRAGAGRR